MGRNPAYIGYPFEAIADLLKVNLSSALVGAVPCLLCTPLLIRLNVINSQEIYIKNILFKFPEAQVDIKYI